MNSRGGEHPDLYKAFFYYINLHQGFYTPVRSTDVLYPLTSSKEDSCYPRTAIASAPW